MVLVVVMVAPILIDTIHVLVERTSLPIAITRLTALK
jgi:hypothetical protein